MSDHEQVFDKPNIFVTGASGSGKSRSIKYLNPETTILLNTERRALPFKGARKFTKQRRINSYREFRHYFATALVAPGINIVILDSWTSLAEMAYNEMVRPVERVGDKVMAAWQTYKDQLHDILIMAKSADRYVVFMGVDTYVQDAQGRMFSTIDVQGSLKTKVEKEFDVVLWSTVFDPDMTQEDSKPTYKFLTNTHNGFKAKSPEDMFPLYIDNDLSIVIDAIYKYYTED